jgi:hypothetical protein
MNKVVSINRKGSINRKRLLGAYIDAQKTERIPEEAVFFTGVFLSAVLPQLTLSAYGGLVPLIAFVSVALVGSIWGWAIYLKSPYRLISCVDAETVPQAPPGEDANLKDAA